MSFSKSQRAQADGFCKTCRQQGRGEVPTGSPRRKYCDACRPENKYHARAVVYQGERFDSQRELARWLVLQELASRDLISDLRRQVRIPLVVAGKKIATYLADFVYVRPVNPIGDLYMGCAVELEQVVEDAKGFRTAAYRLKAKLYEALYGAPIHEV